MATDSGISCSLVIPAYNEEARIRPLLEGIGRFDGELIVVCDGTDRTAGVVEEIAEKRPDLLIRCLRFDHRLGKGGGVLAGLAAAVAPVAGYFDADGSTSIGEMLRLVSAIGSADGAIGSRWVPGSKLTVPQGFMRRMESRGFNLIIRTLYGLPYHDTQCGAKVFRKAALDTVLPAMVSRGFEFDVELLWRMKRAGFSVGEFPIAWQNTGDSRVQSSDMVRMLFGLLKIRFHPGKPQ